MGTAFLMGQSSGGGGANINAALGNYVIYTGETIATGDLVEFINNQAKKSVYAWNGSSAGIPLVFNSATTLYLSAVALDSTRVLVAYSDNGNSLYGTAVILTISGTTITAGTPFVFESAVTYDISVVTLDSTKALVAYKDSGNSSYGTSIILTISDVTITAGTPVVFESGTTESISAVALDSTKVLVAYMDYSNNSYGTSIILTISGTTITKGTAFVFNSLTTDEVSATKLDSTKVLVAYKNFGSSSYGTAIILTISGTTITAGTAIVFNSAITNYTSAVALDSTRVLVAYQHYTTRVGTAIILSISGTTITAGTPFIFDNGETTYISTGLLSANEVLVSYYDKSEGEIVILSISDTTITKAKNFIFNSYNSSDISVTIISSTKALVAYRDYGNNSYGTANVLSEGKLVQGLATQSGIGGETKKFYDWR